MDIGHGRCHLSDLIKHDYLAGVAICECKRNYVFKYEEGEKKRLGGSSVFSMFGLTASPGLFIGACPLVCPACVGPEMVAVG